MTSARLFGGEKPSHWRGSLFAVVNMARRHSRARGPAVTLSDSQVVHVVVVVVERTD